jgi:hypothetical protein
MERETPRVARHHVHAQVRLLGQLCASVFLVARGESPDDRGIESYARNLDSLDNCYVMGPWSAVVSDARAFFFILTDAVSRFLTFDDQGIFRSDHPDVREIIAWAQCVVDEQMSLAEFNERCAEKGRPYADLFRANEFLVVTRAVPGEFDEPGWQLLENDAAAREGRPARLWANWFGSSGPLN